MSAAKQPNNTTTEAENTAIVLEEFKKHEGFCRALLDAYAVIDTNGKVIKANQFLSVLLNKRAKQILKDDSLDESIKLSVNGKALTMRDLVNLEAPTRVDEVRGETSANTNLNLIIGTYPFKSPTTGEALGAFILIRDVTAETNLQFKYADAANKSITDALTGLFTRGYFQDFLSLQMRSMAALPPNSEQRLMSIVMLDIDHFKKINDVHGHQAGDHVLRCMSTVLRRCFRKTDICCRYGGEEFLVILPATDSSGAILAAEKLRAAVEAERFEFEGTHIPVTISSGVAQVKVGFETESETIARADAALYDAKKSGRNRVCVAKTE